MQTFKIEGLGFSSTLFVSVEGTQIFRRRRADLVIVDRFTPKKEGIETVMEIREIEPDVKVITISGGGLTANLELLTLARSFGANHTFAKPFNNLLTTISGYCELGMMKIQPDHPLHPDPDEILGASQRAAKITLFTIAAVTEGTGELGRLHEASGIKIERLTGAVGAIE